MNSTNSQSVAGRSLGLALSLILAGSAYAGPGLEYWQSLGKPTTQTVASAKSASAVVPVCPGSEIVPVTVMKPSWPNGRGPLTAVQIGTERVCHLCTTSKVVTTNDWPSHRGPLVQKVEATKVGATHVCTTACPPSPKA